jgi:hypothetical protein
MGIAQVDIEQMLVEDMGRFYADPLGFVLYAYPWGSGVLKDFDGPFKWQRDVLIDIGLKVAANGFDGIHAVDPILEGVASGHGIGKSALTGWLVDWIMSTRPHAQGTVTANTSSQLETKTWAQIAKWTKLCITSHWFTVNTGRGSMKMYHKDYPESWFCSAQTCKEENSEAFAGQHAVTSTSFYIFDEASAVPNPIWEVAEGGLTDGEPMLFVFGNPTKNAGRFFDCFNKLRHRWKTWRIDSRTVPITNKVQIQAWADDYGDDSDFFRVRVKGVFPRAGTSQFISSELVEAARGKFIHPNSYRHAPKVLGVDVARFGDDQTVFIRRQGLAAYGLKKFRKFDTMKVASLVAVEINEWNPDAVFIDLGNMGAGVVDRLHQLGYDMVIGINFGSTADDESKYFNKRSEMWGEIKEWLAAGGSIPDDPELADDLTGPEYGFDAKERIQLERKQDMKKRGVASPDCGDALALTKAQKVYSRNDELMDLLRQNVEEKHDPLNYLRRKRASNE